MTDIISKSIIAPAGCGKTHRIVESVAKLVGKRTLVLTHTNAGVGVLRDRLALKKVSTKRYALSTIDGWCLRLVTAYPKTSGILIPKDAQPPWSEVRKGAVRVLGNPFSKAVLRASYGRIYVDEYQDCNLDQHSVVQALSRVVPTRVVGDPLQGIFAFGEQRDSIVSWISHVCPAFPLDKDARWEPKRWDANPALGEFIVRMRHQIIAGRPIDIDCSAVTVIPEDEGMALTYIQKLARNGDHILVIRSMDRRCPYMARRLGRPFRCVESVDCKRLMAFMETAKKANGNGLPLAVIDFAKDCMTGVAALKKPVRARLNVKAGIRSPAVKPELESVLTSCRLLAESKSLSDVGGLLSHFKTGHLFRPDPIMLLRASIAIRPQALVADWQSVVSEVRERIRQISRSQIKCGVGTTKLVKGLQADHVIVMDVEQMDAADLYVALTRGTKSLTVITNSKVLQPASYPPRVQEAIQAGLLES